MRVSRLQGPKPVAWFSNTGYPCVVHVKDKENLLLGVWPIQQLWRGFCLQCTLFDHSRGKFSLQRSSVPKGFPHLHVYQDKNHSPSCWKHKLNPWMLAQWVDRQKTVYVLHMYFKLQMAKTCANIFKDIGAVYSGWSYLSSSTGWGYGVAFLKNFFFQKAKKLQNLLFHAMELEIVLPWLGHYTQNYADFFFGLIILKF